MDRNIEVIKLKIDTAKIEGFDLNNRLRVLSIQANNIQMQMKQINEQVNLKTTEIVSFEGLIKEIEEKEKIFADEMLDKKATPEVKSTPKPEPNHK